MNQVQYVKVNFITWPTLQTKEYKLTNHSPTSTQSIMQYHNHGQIIDALQRCQNNPNIAIGFLANQPKPPSIKEHPVEWFRYFDPTNSGGLTKEEIVWALHLSFGSDLRTGVSVCLCVEVSVYAQYSYIISFYSGLIPRGMMFVLFPF